MRQLIVGCGYLGRRVAAAWLGAGHEVCALTRTAARADELRESGIEPIIGDVTDRDSLSRLPPADTLLYAVGYDRGAGHSQRTVYVDGLRNVLWEVGGRIGRLIYISSTSVYGQQQGEWIDETSPTVPVTSSGEICLAAEQVVREYFPANANDGGQAAVVLRLSGIYGPGRLLRRIAEINSAAPIAGDERGWLNLIHVDDAVAAVCAAESRALPGSTYIVTDDRPVTRGEYYRLLAELTGGQPPVFEPSAATGKGAAGLGKRCRNDKLRNDLGIALRYPTISAGLPHAVT